MEVIDKREKREEWHVGDIICFGNHTVNENCGIIVSMNSRSDSINLIILKGDHFKQGYAGFYMYPSTTALKEKLYELYRFIKRTDSNDIERVFARIANKYDRDDILMCKYQISDKDFDLYEINQASSQAQNAPKVDLDCSMGEFISIIYMSFLTGLVWRLNVWAKKHSLDLLVIPLTILTNIFTLTTIVGTIIVLVLLFF